MSVQDQVRDLDNVFLAHKRKPSGGGYSTAKELYMKYKYGMRLRGFSIGCQPMDGFIERQDDTRGKYHDILIYNRMLTTEELKAYELDYIGTEHKRE